MIRNFRSQDWICLINVDLEMNIVSLKEMVYRKSKNETFVRGFYINQDGNLLGIAASSKGPLLFTSRGAYVLEEDSYLFRLTHDNELNTFTFSWKGRVILEQQYTRTLFRERRGWNDDKLVDFFAWLCAVGKRKNFQSFYTVDYPLQDSQQDSFDLIVPLNPAPYSPEEAATDRGEGESGP